VRTTLKRLHGISKEDDNNSARGIANILCVVCVTTPTLSLGSPSVEPSNSASGTRLCHDSNAPRLKNLFHVSGRCLSLCLTARFVLLRFLSALFPTFELTAPSDRDMDRNQTLCDHHVHAALTWA
jgi:hypothetical protein